MQVRAMTISAILAGLILGATAWMFPAGSARAHPGEGPPTPLDFITGGGFIVRPTGDKGNFGVGGGVKNGAFWGHLNYIDHGNGLHVQAQQQDITGYILIDERTRDICGHAQTDLFGDVLFHVRVTDNGEPGVNDIFIIRLGKNGVFVYTTENDPDHTLGGSQPGGGNIQLHKGNNSNTAPATPSVCDI